MTSFQYCPQTPFIIRAHNTQLKGRHPVCLWTGCERQTPGTGWNRLMTLRGHQGAFL